METTISKLSGNNHYFPTKFLTSIFCPLRLDGTPSLFTLISARGVVHICQSIAADRKTCHCFVRV